MHQEWTRDSILLVIKKDLLLDNLDLANDGVTLEDIKDDTPLMGDGLSIDSVDALDLLVGVERKFRLSLPDLNASFIESTCKDVGTLADFVVSQLEKSENA